MVDQLNSFASEEVTRVAREVGTEGKLGGQAHVPASPAPGRTLTDRELDGRQPHRQVRNIAEVTTGVAAATSREDHGRRVKGEILELKTPSTRWSTSSTHSPPR